MVEYVWGPRDPGCLTLVGYLESVCVLSDSVWFPLQLGGTALPRLMYILHHVCHSHTIYADHTVGVDPSIVKYTSQERICATAYFDPAGTVFVSDQVPEIVSALMIFEDIPHTPFVTVVAPTVGSATTAPVIS